MVLHDELIIDRLEEIFVPNTASRRQVEAAKYNLRVSREELVAPDGTTYKSRGEFVGPIRLASGEAAMLASYEKLQVPWDLIGHISPKFHTVSNGLLVLYGSVVDPGFGLGCGGKRLWIQVVNVSDRSIILDIGEHGESVIALTFSQLTGRPRDTGRYLSEDGLEVDVHRFVGGLELLTKLRNAEVEFERIRTKVDVVLVFGLYLLGTAALGATTAILVALGWSNTIQKLSHSMRWPFASTVLGVLLVLTLLGFWWGHPLGDRRRGRRGRRA